MGCSTEYHAVNLVYTIDLRQHNPIQGVSYVNETGDLVPVTDSTFVRRFVERDYLLPLPGKEVDLNKNSSQNDDW